VRRHARGGELLWQQLRKLLQGPEVQEGEVLSDELLRNE
jgi:hypothetical protein